MSREVRNLVVCKQNNPSHKSQIPLPPKSGIGMTHIRFKNPIFSFIVLLLVCYISKSYAQDKPVWKQDTIIGNNIFRKHSNWLSAGAGVARNNQLAKTQFAGGLDYNFHLRAEYFQLGLFLSGDAYGNYNNYQFHVCYGKRVETTSINFSYFAGPSYSVLFEYIGNKPKSSPDNALGIYAAAQLIKKVKFDVGIGGGLFADINTRQSVVGAKIDIYFSGAYKGKTE